MRVSPPPRAWPRVPVGALIVGARDAVASVALTVAATVVVGVVIAVFGTVATVAVNVCVFWSLRAPGAARGQCRRRL